jgi:hypothetical protein
MRAGPQRRRIGAGVVWECMAEELPLPTGAEVYDPTQGIAILPVLHFDKPYR